MKIKVPVSPLSCFRSLGCEFNLSWGAGNELGIEYKIEILKNGLFQDFYSMKITRKPWGVLEKCVPRMWKLADRAQLKTADDGRMG